MSKISEQTTPYIESFASGKKWLDTINSEGTKELYFRHLKLHGEAARGKQKTNIVSII